MCLQLDLLALNNYLELFTRFYFSLDEKTPMPEVLWHRRFRYYLAEAVAVTTAEFATGAFATSVKV
jgi:hypothetical protein